MLAVLSDLSAAKAWRVTVEVDHNERSNAQNRALWGVALRTISEATGHDPEDLKTYFMGEWSGWHVVDVFGQQRRVPVKRSSQLNKQEFVEFYEFIQRRAAECGYNVPSPNEF